MPDSTSSRKRGKVAKPRPDFPLFPHATGRWAKKVRGRLCYFGKTSDDPKGERALERWLDEKEELLAGRVPHRVGAEGPAVRDLCEDFLQAKKRLVESGELSQQSFLDYKETCDGIVGAFGKHQRLDDLRPEDFDRLRARLAKRLGPVSLGNEINRVRVVFKFGFDSDLVERPVKYGPHFKRPSKRVLRLARKKNGLRMFEAAELRTLIDKATQPLKAMILLGINGGLGASDLARLEASSLDLKAGWLDYPRPKTGIDRKIPLWPETVEAVTEAIAQRSKPRDIEHDDLVFLTKLGNPWVRFSPVYEDEDENQKGGIPLDAIGQKFAKLLEDEGLKRLRLGFYALRHTLETIGGEAKDQVALDAIMGHARDDMASVYRERISNERLRAVTDHVHRWLFPPETKDEGQAVGEKARAK